MKLKQSIRYQLADFIGPVIIYYGVVIALHIVLCLAWIFGSIRAYMSGGLSAFSTVFLFICGLCSFHDNLPMHLQKRASAGKAMYTAWLAVTGHCVRVYGGGGHGAGRSHRPAGSAHLGAMAPPNFGFSPCLTWTAWPLGKP